MAPALTELSSQTNKLSSSATSASPRPSSETSESVSPRSSTALNNNFITGYRNRNFSEQSSQPSDLSSCDDSHMPNQQQTKRFKEDRKNTFQSAFEQFQQIHQVNLPTTRNKSPSKSAKNGDNSSNLNGRISRDQMGQLCDRNIEFQGIDDIVKKQDKSFKCVKKIGEHMDLSDVSPVKHIVDKNESCEQQSGQVHRSQAKEGDISDSNSETKTPVPNNKKHINSKSCFTPEKTTSPSMGLQKDLMKESADMEQVLGELGTTEMDLLQVLKGFDSTPGGESAFCELSLFTDVDVMNMEEVPSQNRKDSDTIEICQKIGKTQAKMQRKCDFLLRRLRKIQARCMGRHATEEIAGLFEWQANPTTRRKESSESLSFYEEKRRNQISTAVMRSFVRKIKNVSDHQHSNSPVKRSKNGLPSTMQTNFTASQHPLPPVVPQINETLLAELTSVSGHLCKELTEINSAMDSDATGSSSGGDSADEMEPFHNALQQHLPIAKRAGWKWLQDRAAIATRWAWLLTQISDLEYRIRQHNDLHHQLRKSKGFVSFDKSQPVDETAVTNGPISPSSVNGYRGVLPGNIKSCDADVGATHSGSCRTQAFKTSGFRKRKLLQTVNIHTVSKKAAKPSSVKCGCQWPLHPCGLCTGRADPTAPRDLPDTMTVSEKVALLDSGFHPVLSFPEDFANSIHVEATARLSDWQSRVVSSSSKSSSSILKGTSSHKASREEKSKKYVDNRSKCSRKDKVVDNKLLKGSKQRRSFQGDQYNNKHRSLDSSGSLNSGFVIGSNNGVGSSSTGASDLIVDSIDANGQPLRSKNASPTPGNFNSSYNKSERMDRRNRNSYDIDNIVIPYSVAATTRVEILPYKEIPTPKWRVLDDSNELSNNSLKDTSKSNSCEQQTDTVECEQQTDTVECETPPTNECNLSDSFTFQNESEDISNEAFLQRHERALIEEKKKFQTFLKYPWSTRSRANRRMDSRAESSGTNTPNPSSPVPNVLPGGDIEAASSPSAPSTPHISDMTEDLSGMCQDTAPDISNQLSFCATAKRTERKRTASGRKDREQSKDDPFYTIASEQKEFIPPYTRLDFPLSDDAYKTMLDLMPNEHQLEESSAQQQETILTQVMGNGTANSQQLLSSDAIYPEADSIEEKNLHISYQKNDSRVFNFLGGAQRSDSPIPGDSDTDSAESGNQYEDPADPEWFEPE